MGREEMTTDGEETVQQPETEALRDALAPDELYGSLASTIRRRVLYFLLEHDRTTVDELADVLAGWEAAAENEHVGRETRRRLYVSLYHAHLPRLAEAGLVAYDADTGDVSLSTLSAATVEVIRHAAGYERETVAAER